MHNPITNDLELDAASAHAIVAHSGAQVVVADLDADGDPEILSTLDVLPAPQQGVSALRSPERPADPDALVVSSWRIGGAVQERFRMPVPAGIRALAACPPDGSGAAAVVLAVPGELWIVR